MPASAPKRLLTGALALLAAVLAGVQMRAVVAEGSAIGQANAAFYNAHYEDAAALALDHQAAAPNDLAGYELRTSALLFQLKHLLGDDKKRIRTLETCPPCRPLLTAFQRDTATAQGLARARLRAVPTDVRTRFYLGKVNLNHVWLHLGPLGRKTGWREYREAKESLETVLATEPAHVRALVARAWIDYIVDTRMPWGTKWLFGGGSRTRALDAVKRAVSLESEFYAGVEARFALWEMLVREGDRPAAVAVARELARDFPENADLVRFLEAGGVPAPLN
jgi:hypothetical protein